MALIVSLLTGCATTGTHAGLVGVAAGTQQPKTVVTVIFPRGYPLSASYDIYQEDEFVAKVAPGNYLVWETVIPADGRLLVSAKGEQNDLAVVRSEAGQPAYLKIEIGASLTVWPTMQLLPATSAEAEAFMQKGNRLASAL